MPETSLVTGGAGFLGRHLVRGLLDRGDSVRVLDVREPSGPREGARFLPGSVTDGEVVARAVRGVDRVFHLAARTDLWARDPGEYERVNRVGARTVFRAAEEAGVERVIHTSTEAVLRNFRGGATGHGEGGDGGRGPSPDLRHVPDPREMPGAYCRSKALGEREAREAHRRGLPVVVVNPTVPVGPGDPGDTPPGRMLLGFLNGEVPAFTEGWLDLVDVRDLARGEIVAAERGAPGRRYVLGGHRVRISRFLALLEELTGLSMPGVRIPYPVALGAGYLSELVADHVTGRRPRATVAGVRLTRARPRHDPEAARRELGLSVRPLRETLRDTVRWLRDRGLLRRPVEVA
jgi:dihydroflavonol-4-reductase